MNSALQRLVLVRDGERGEILWVSLCNALMRNAMDDTMQRELLALFAGLRGDETLRCVILRGDGAEAFCSGGDINAFKDMTPIKGERYLVERGQALASAIRDLGVPVIAAVDGWCLAGGTELMLMCDFAFATEKARFGLPEINLGLLPGWGGVARLPSAIGPRRAREMLMRARFLSGREAFDWGLVNRVFPDAEALYTEALTAARDIAGKPRTAVRLIREVVEQAGEPDSRALALERGAVTLLMSSPNFAEGVAAFREKRAPDFGPDL